MIIKFDIRKVYIIKGYIRRYMSDTSTQDQDIIGYRGIGEIPIPDDLRTDGLFNKPLDFKMIFNECIKRRQYIEFEEI